MYDGTFHGKWAACKQTCAAHGIYADSAGEFGLNWFDPTRPDRGVQLLPSRWYGMRNKTVIHFVRHPVDMVLSGYFYHKQCAEPHWTRTWDFGRWKQYFPPQSVMVDYYAQSQRLGLHSFCAFLQKVPERRGVEAEVARTLNCIDGVGNMVHLFAARNISDVNNVITICMSSIDPARQSKKNILDYWREKLQSLPAVDFDVLATYLVTSPQIRGHSTIKRTANLSGIADHAFRALLSSSTPNGRAELAKLAGACPSDYGVFDFLATGTNKTSKNAQLMQHGTAPPPPDEPTRIDSDTDRSEDTDQAKAEQNWVAVVKGAEKPVIETKDKYVIYGPLQKATLQKITTLSEKVTKMEDQLVKLTATVEEQKKLIASQSVIINASHKPELAEEIHTKLTNTEERKALDSSPLINTPGINYKERDMEIIKQEIADKRSQ